MSWNFKGLAFAGLFAAAGLAFAFLMGGGHNGVPTLLPDQIAATYTRTGTSIKIEIGNSTAYFGHPVPSDDFTPAEIALIEGALDTLTVQQLSGVYTIIPAPQKSTPPSGNYGGQIFIDPNDPNLVKDLITYIENPVPPGPTPDPGPDPFSGPDLSTSGTPQVSMLTKTPINAQIFDVVSSQRPSDYVPFSSAKGLMAVEDDLNMVKNSTPKTVPTLQDQVRPHGSSFEIAMPNKATP
jgi:hypothetical protein